MGKIAEIKDIWLSGIWAILSLILAVAAVIHNFPMGEPTFLAEFSAFILITVMLYNPTSSIAALATFGSLMWLGNQYIHWYMGGLQLEENAPFFWMTALINFLLMLGALFIATREQSQSKASIGIEMLPLLVMFVYAVWKMYLDFVVYAGVEPAFSGGLWASGIMLATTGSMLVKVKPETEKLALVIAIFGLIISSYAAIVYGQWLSIFR